MIASQSARAADGARHGNEAPRGLAASPSSAAGRFTRLFAHLPRCGAGPDAIEKLADRLDPGLVGPSRENVNIPAGYTYLGQFIDHDLTFDAGSKIDGDNDPDALVNFRSARFDLDSLYGSGPADQPFLYDWDDPHPGVKLLVGHNPSGHCWAPCDLPRNEQQRAIIGDSRNDEHLIISQLHLLFIRFHNSVVCELHRRDNTLIGNALFDEAHRMVRWHYQWIVLHDFLKHVISPDLWKVLLPRLHGDRGEEVDPAACTWNVARMPVEFSINEPHACPGAAVPLFPDPKRPDAGDLGGFRRLPGTLQIEWTRFFGPSPRVSSMVLDHRLTLPLASLPPDGASLARLNLRRSAALGLPAGSDVARALGFDALSDDELFPPTFWPADGSDARAAVLRDPPLWFYVLREAAKRGNSGAWLGPVGGRIVAEVLIGLVEADPSSYLHASPAWKPTLKRSDPEPTGAKLAHATVRAPTVAQVMEFPHALHRATPAELKERIEAERRGRPFLLYRDADEAQRIVDLGDAPERLTIGRSAFNDLALPWDGEVSRVHASLERLGAEWTFVDDGRSHNGSYIDGERVRGRARLHDGDAISVGRTIVIFRSPTGRDSLPTMTSRQRAMPAITDAQRRVLVALCRPCADSSYAAPATNRQIADELVLGVETIKTHMRALFDAFELDVPAQHHKRAALAQQAFETGAVTAQDFTP